MKINPDNSFRNSLLTLAVALLLAGFSGISISNLKLVEDVSETLPQSEALNEYKSLYNRTGITGSILVAFQANENETHFDAAEQLAVSLESDTSGLITDVRLGMDAREPRALLDHYVKYLPVYAEPSDLDSLNDDSFIKKRLTNTMDKLRSLSGLGMKEMLVADPLQLVVPRLNDMEKLGGSSRFQIKDGYLYTQDGDYLIMLVEPTYPPSESEKNSALVHNLEIQVEALKTEHKIGKTMLFGGPVIAVTNADQIRADIRVVATMSIAFILFLLIIVFRNPITPLLFVFPPALGFMMGLGAYSLIAERISALALGVSTIMLGIAIDYSFHFFNHYRHNSSVKQTLKEIKSPLLLGCATTVMAFFGLNFLNSGILREFGLLAGFILIFSALSVLVFLPALIRVTGFKMKEVKPIFAGVQLPSIFQKLALPVFAILTIGLFFFADEAQFEDDLNELNYFPEHLQEAQDIISGPSSDEQVYVLLKGDEGSAVSRGQELATALEELRSTGTELNFSSAASVLLNKEEVDERINSWNKNSSGEELINRIESIGAEVGFKSGMFSQYRNALSSDFDSLYVDAFNSPVLEDLVLRTDSSFAVIVPISVKKTDREKLEQTIISVGEEPVATSSLAKVLVDSVNDDLNFILILTSGLVLITLLLTYGRIELALLTFIPMILSWVWILGVCGIFG
ncbi:MAG: putative exporter, partial [Oceanospirillaceae bacterium]